MVPLIKTSEGWGEEIGSRHEEELWEVNDVEELGTETNIEPHPVSVRLQTNGLDSKKFEEV